MSKSLILRILIGIAILVVLGFITFWILPVSVPIIVALLTALMLEPGVRFMQHYFKIKKRYFSVLLVFSLFLCLLTLSGYILVTKVVTETISIYNNLPTYIADINTVWKDVESNLEEVSKDLPSEVVNTIKDEANKSFTEFKDKLISSDENNYIDKLAVFASKVVTAIPQYIVSFLVYLIALFLFLLELPRIKSRLYAHLKEKTASKVHFMTSRLSNVIFGFLKAQFLVSIIIFIASFIGLYIISPEHALVMSFIIWIIDFIPIIGSIVILGPWALYHFIVGNIILGAKLAILAAILLVIRRTVEPKVMGKHIGLSPLSTLISMYLGLKLLGIIGFVVGPLVVIMFNTAREAGLIKLNFKI